MNSSELQEKVATLLNEKKPNVLADIAKACDASELEVAEAFPHGTVSFAPSADFDRIWQTISEWESATFIMHHLGSILEIGGNISMGSHAHGYFNLHEDNHLGGHFKVDDLSEICFMRKPFMGNETCSVQFFNEKGAVKFSIFVGRDDTQAMIPNVVESFKKLQKSYAHTA